MSGWPEREPREVGGYDVRYADAPSFDNPGPGYPAVARGGQMALNSRDAFDAPDAWEPARPAGIPFNGAPTRGSRADKAPAKPRKGGAFALAFRLLTIVIVVVGLVAVVGAEFAPKLSKYLPFLRTAAQTTPPPTFATYTPGPTPTNLPNYKLFTGTAIGYAMEYPASWGTSTLTDAKNNDTVNQFAQANGATIVNVERAPAFDTATDAQLIQAEVQGAQDQGTTLTEISGAATTEGVGGEIWQRHEYQATNKNGAKLHIAILASHHLGKGYVIALISGDTTFSSNDTTVFEPMLRTFRFL